MNKLKEVRNALNLTQKELSEKIPLSRSQIANIENGNRTLTNRIEQDMVKYLGVNPAWIEDSSNEMFLNKFDGEDLTPEETEFLELFSSLDEDQKNMILSKLKEISSKKEKE